MNKPILHICLFSIMLLCSVKASTQSSWIDSLKKVVATRQEDTGKVWMLNSISNYFSLNDPEAGLIFAKQALALSEKLHYDKGIFWSIVSLDHCLYVLGNYTMELDYALKAFPLAKTLNDQDATGWSNGMLADSYINLGDYNTAMIYIRVILKIMEQSSPKNLVLGYANIVPIYIGLHDYDSALICAKKSYSLMKTDSLLYYGSGEDSKFGRNEVYLFLGQAFASKAIYDSALFYYHLSIPLSEELNAKIFQIDAFNGVAKAYKETNKADSATWYAKKVLAEKIIGSYPAGELKAANLLADIYESQKVADSSLKYLRMTVTLKDSFYNREKTTTFQNLLRKEQEKQKEIEAATNSLQNRYRMYAAMALLVISLVVAGIFIRNKRIKQLQKMRNNIAGDLHDDIGSTLSSISIMSELAKSKSPEAGPLLNSISENAAAIQENMSDIIWAVNPKNDHFDNVLQRMNLFAEEILDAKNIRLEFTSDPSLAAYPFTMKQRKNLYLFFKEAINNAAKYSEADKVFVRITKKNRHVEMNIADNGKGFDTTAVFNGNGMNTFKKRAEELDAEFKIISPANEGTNVQLIFKIT